MKLREEMSHDLNFRQPRVIADDKLTIIENVTAIVMISETSLTVSAGKKFVTEIFEGRLLIEGTIQGIEFFRTSGKDKD